MVSRFLKGQRKKSIQQKSERNTHKSLDRLITNYLNKQRVPISIGAFSTLYIYLMPKIVPKLKKDYPNFEISAVENDTHKLIDMLL